MFCYRAKYHFLWANFTTNFSRGSQDPGPKPSKSTNSWYLRIPPQVSYKFETPCISSYLHTDTSSVGCWIATSCKTYFFFNVPEPELQNSNHSSFISIHRNVGKDNIHTSHVRIPLSFLIKSKIVNITNIQNNIPLRFWAGYRVEEKLSAIEWASGVWLASATGSTTSEINLNLSSRKFRAPKCQMSGPPVHKNRNEWY